MDLDHAAPFVGGELHHGLAELNPGVIDEDVDLDALGVEALESGEDRLFVGDVEGVRLDLMPGFRKSLRGVRQLLLVAAVENDLLRPPPRGPAPSQAQARPRIR